MFFSDSATLATPVVNGNRVTLAWITGDDSTALSLYMSLTSVTKPSGILASPALLQDVTGKSTFSTSLPHGTYFWQIVSEGCQPRQQIASTVLFFNVWKDEEADFLKSRVSYRNSDKDGIRDNILDDRFVFGPMRHRDDCTCCPTATCLPSITGTARVGTLQPAERAMVVTSRARRHCLRYLLPWNEHYWMGLARGTTSSREWSPEIYFYFKLINLFM